MQRAEDRFFGEISEHAATVTAIENELAEPFGALARAASAALKNGNKLLFFGNGGSAADAQHLATEFVVRFHKNRKSLAAIALTTDTSILTAAGNDFGFETIFARQIEGLGNKGDIAIGISTSGNSPNVLKALETAREMGLTTVGLGGCTGGGLKQLCDICLIVPSFSTARIQECHILLGHILCTVIDSEYPEDKAEDQTAV